MSTYFNKNMATTSTPPKFSVSGGSSEVESWLLAHPQAIANFLGIRREEIPQNVDEIPDPKKFLIELAKKSKNRKLRDAIVPSSKSTAKVGPDYNGQMIYYVQNHWQVEVAKHVSPSLHRAVNVIDRFEPIWSN